MRRSTVDVARGRWPGILLHFGLEERFLQNRSGPCPMCGGKDRYRFDDKHGNGDFYCNQCGAGRGFDLLMDIKDCDFAAAAQLVDELLNNQEIPTSAPPAAQRGNPVVRLRKVADQFQPAKDSPVYDYLASRGLTPALQTAYVPNMAYFEDRKRLGNYPAMAHMFRDPAGKALTIHVTYLTEGGEKAPVGAAKKVLPPVARLAGGAIRLTLPGRPEVCAELGIAEGVETALAVARRKKYPVWAAYSATLLESFEPPEYVEHLHIFGDRDGSFTGQKAAYILANRLSVGPRKLRVTVHLPRKLDTDFADELGHGG